jgi:GNAT superfamily N-acetyltransferase
MRESSSEVSKAAPDREFTAVLSYSELGLPMVEIISEEEKIADADLVYNKNDKTVEISWFTVAASFQGKGLAAGAYSSLLHKIEEQWHPVYIDSTTSEKPMVRVWAKATLPEGWSRQYELHERDEASLRILEDSEEIIDEAIDCIEGGGYILQRLERRQSA